MILLAALQYAMPIYVGVWRAKRRIDYNLPPSDPDLQRHQLENFHDALRRELPRGWVREVRAFVEGGGGYFVTKEIDRHRFEVELGRWFPRTVFEVQVHETVPEPESLDRGPSASARSDAVTS